MNNDLHFSTGNNIHETPQDLFDKLNKQFSFTLDPCALPGNAKCKKFFTPDDDSLNKDWSKDVVFMNPPYSEPEQPCKTNCKKKRCHDRGFHLDHYVPGCIDFMKKAYESSLAGATVVCLVASRTGNEWFHTYAKKGKIKFLKGRLHFNNAPTPAPFDSIIVVFSKKHIFPCESSDCLNFLEVSDAWQGVNAELIEGWKVETHKVLCPAHNQEAFHARM